MIKNIILDVGGILFDDSKANTEKVLNKNCDLIYKNAYGKGFRDCLLGLKSIDEHIESLKGADDLEDIKYILSKENQPICLPLIKENFEYIRPLRGQGYKLYLLTNITEDSYNYINDVIDINANFDGGIYSYKEHLIKPDTNIYELIIDRFKLDKGETIFFDDKEKNVIAAQNIGIKSIVFKSIDDIKKNI